MAKQLILDGKVQGVFCRYFCEQNAKRLGLKGSATNKADGTVQILINSDDEKLIADYTSALKENPYRFKFYGSIKEISVTDYDGPMEGDYMF